MLLYTKGRVWKVLADQLAPDAELLKHADPVLSQNFDVMDMSHVSDVIINIITAIMGLPSVHRQMPLRTVSLQSTRQPRLINRGLGWKIKV
jgi:hypothetical protein